MTEINMTSLAFKPDDVAIQNTCADTGVIDLPLDMSVFAPTGDIPADESDDKCSISDALIRCIRDTGHVDIGRIAMYSDVSAIEAANALKGSIYHNPDTWGGRFDQGWETADEYLSGNIRNKLIRARVANKMYRGAFADNIEALEALLPPETRAEDIYVTLGSPWLPEEIVDEFINYLIQPHEYHRCRGVRHDIETGSWEIPDKPIYNAYVRNKSTYGTERIDAIHIIERTLNMRTIRITDEVSSASTKRGTTRVLNREETAAAQEKQSLILDEFRRWIWQDEERARKVKKIFDKKYGCIVARQFHGGFLEFPGMAEGVGLYPYQKDAVARIMFTPNTLLAHDVGAGKTYIMIAAAMELRRLGMAKKCMFVVPNNLVGQWEHIFREIYPQANLLCIEPGDMDPDHRNSTLRRVVSGEHDGIIIAYSCFDRIPLSRKSHIEALKAERDGLEEIRLKKKKITSGLKKRIDKLSKELAELAVSDDLSKEFICFDDLGIDRLFVDEAHNYKNVSVDTSIFGVYGISSKGSSKCDSMMAKVHYVQKHHNGGGVVMATGTPITNSISDIYVFQQYLQSGELELMGLQKFDNWVGMFAEKKTEFEIAVDTGSFRMATRFSRFHNIPELTTILTSIADFHNLSGGSDLPEFEGYTDVLIPRSDALKEYLEEISRRADRIHQHKVKRDEDNMLKVTGDGRKAALDIRLVSSKEVSESTYSHVGAAQPEYLDISEQCKAGECAERVAMIWHKTRSDRLAQLVFCDTSTPKAGFNIYDELKRRLVYLGVDGAEIAFVHDAATEKRREKLFRDVREGKVRVLIGSTFKLGLGVNVQDRLVAIHHLDLPWRPADMVQREGRILRAGNLNPKIDIYRYITEGSFDAYSWQLLETKQRFITDILSGTIAGRSGDEVDDTVLNYAEVKALALGNPLLKSRVETSNEISRLSILRRKSQESRHMLEQRLDELPDKIAIKQQELDMCTADHRYVTDELDHFYDIMFAGDKAQIASWRYIVKDHIARSLSSNIMKNRDRSLIDYKGFMVVLPAGMEADRPFVYLVREGKYRVDLSDKTSGILIRLDNCINGLDKREGRLMRELDILKQELSEIEAELIAADSYADKIEEYTNRLSEIDKELGVDEALKQSG